MTPNKRHETMLRRLKHPYRRKAIWLSSACSAVCACVLSTTVWAQSFGTVDPRNVGRDYKSLDEIYAIAPTIMAGQYTMSRAQSAIIEPSITVRTNGISTATLDSRIFDQGTQPIIEPIGETNWVWIGTTSAIAVAGIVAYLMQTNR